MSAARKGLGFAILSIALLTAASPAAGPRPKAGEPLIEATRRGDVAAVRTLLRDGADPSAAQGDGLTALHVAAETGNLEITRLLIAGKADVQAKSRLGGYTPLHLAAGAAHVEVVRALVQAGADVKAVTTTGGVTPLHLAAKALNGEAAVRVLIEAGAPVNALDGTSGQTPLMFAAGYGRAASVRELLRAGAEPDVATEVVDVLERLYIDQEARTQLSQALQGFRAASGDTDRASTWKEQQAAIAAQREFLQDREWQEGLLYGFHPDWLASVQPWWSLQNGVDQSSDLVVRRPQQETLVGKTGGMTALLFAAREGRIEAAQALLDGGAAIDRQSGDGTTPLVSALLNGHFDLALRLIERGADVNLATYTDGVAPLFALLQTQWTLKFTNHPQPRAQDNQQTEHMPVLNALLERGANPNARLNTHLWHLEWEGKFGMDITGATPFWRAALAQDLEAMKALAAHGADPNIPTSWPEPGMRESRQEDGRVAEDSGLPVMPQGWPNAYPIHMAAGGGYLGLGAFQQNNVPNNFMPSVQFLVEELGLDVNIPDAWGYTPLHYAAVRGDNALIEYLVSKGADIKAVTRLGQSVVDMTRGGRNGFFSRTPYPATEELLLKLGSEYKCLNTHMRNNGDYCPGTGVAPFKDALENTEVVTQF
jgi:ankyrin repeat protein